jgi:hypothetical protein
LLSGSPCQTGCVHQVYSCDDRVAIGCRRRAPGTQKRRLRYDFRVVAGRTIDLRQLDPLPGFWHLQ